MFCQLWTYLNLLSEHLFLYLGTIRSASATPSNSPQSSTQSVYQPAQQGSPSVPRAPASASSLKSPPDQPTWNPFGDDNFSKLTAEDLLNKDFTKLADGNFTFSQTTVYLITYMCLCVCIYMHIQIYTHIYRLYIYLCVCVESVKSTMLYYALEGVWEMNFGIGLSMY